MRIENMDMGKGITLWVLPTKKFKTVTISFCFHRDLNEDYTYNALIPAVLKRGCEGFETLKDIERHLESLYGALFDVGVQKKGERQVLRFSMEVVNDDYLAEQGILAQAFYFLNRVINRPVLENGGFKKSYVAQEKENLKNRIKSLVNDKIQYSLERCAQEMCKGEKYSRYVFGNINELENLDDARLYSVYCDVTQSSPLDVFVVGDIDPAKVRLLLERSLSMERKQVRTIPKTTYKKLQVVPKTVTEEMDVNQGKLAMGFRTNINATDKEYFPLLVYSSILGGGPHSKLFINVREKASLAYYAFARLEKFKGLMFIGAGIDFDKYEQTVNIIMEQLDAVAKGHITQQEFEGAINALVTSLKGSMDQPSQLIDYYLGNSVMDSDITVEELIERIKGVTVDQVVEVSDRIKLDTIYFLRNRKRGYVIHEKRN
ncbi:putative Zn-dependent peptidase [Caldicoprobacter guelmensis]|uniref:EF-P 5-aminopentanol modification-associated protein YfmF n=1 Tax=Caldicoprobacter guelmensis TaxID=1170224 RepID=UPI001959C1C2|nr:pitrilysin family protein [Caldicoprobacter guelmensis]MBM7581772.1 putative Zn-dependent peptidase [Caldicoprobacter guelmensis]